jgi:diguanylate cyclase (GGDEF)-like protein/PAS domain S-box-containing protein
MRMVGGILVRLARSTERERAIRDAAARLAGTSDRNELAQHAAQGLRTLLPADRPARVCLALRDGAGLQVAAGVPPVAADRIDVTTLAPAHRHALDRGALLELTPEEAAALWPGPPAGGPVLAAGLVAAGRLEGIALVAGTPVDDDDRAAMLTLVEHAALALGSASLSDELHRRRADQRLAALTRHTRDLIAVLDRDARVQHATGACQAVIGVDAASLQGTAIAGHVHPDDVVAITAWLASALGDSADVPALECRMGSEGAGWRHVEAVGSNLLDVPGVDGLVLTVRDVSERRNMEEGLRHQAYHDALTGLPNRLVLTERAAHALQRTRGRSTRRPVVMILDLDGFKSINDAVGHSGGDEVIAAVAQRIAACLRPGDTAARMGGDEFAVLLEDVAELGDAIAVAERLVRSIEAPYRAAGRTVSLSACVGIAPCGGDDTSVRDLLGDADLAMYVAKARGRGAREVFTPELHRAQTERLRMQEHLGEALQRGQLHVVYQPQVDIAGKRVTGAEALVRWTHPEHGEVPPDVFVPMAEQLGLITDIDRWVLQTACADLARWREMGFTSLRVAVNISGCDLDSERLVDDVRRALLLHMLDPWQLELELTEGTAVRQPETAVQRLHALRAVGVRIAIDDFGTGYSMFSRLRALPIDRLKIDRSFVLDLSWDDDAAAIVQSTVTMGHALGLTLVAEGVESEDVLGRLADLGCDSAQGFHISLPLPAGEFATWLASTHWNAGAVAALVS